MLQVNIELEASTALSMDDITAADIAPKPETEIDRMFIETLFFFLTHLRKGKIKEPITPFLPKCFHLSTIFFFFFDRSCNYMQ